MTSYSREVANYAASRLLAFTTRLLAWDIETHDSTGPGTALVTRTGANPVQVVCPGVSLCAWHSNGVSNRKPAADIRNRRSSPSTLCRLTDVAGAVNSSVHPR